MEEAAEKLGVEYKTLYRLVRSGELPAGKIGRIYRIREEDLEAYFDKQKRHVVEQAQRSGLTALEGLMCGACGRGILSELSIGGRCEQTGKPICQACWSIKKIRRCEPEAAKPAAAAEPASRQGGRAPETPPGKPSRTAEPPKPPKPPAEKVEDVIERLRRDGKPVVSAADAREAEESFLRSFGRRLEEIEQLPDPLTGRAMALRSARVKHEIVVGVKGDDRLPGNRVSRFALKTGGWGKPGGQLVLECRFLSRPEAIKSKLYDAEPIGSSELQAVLNDLSDRAKKAGCFHVALIGSPTGFADAAAAMAAGGRGGKAFRDRRVGVVLCDLCADKTILDASDERLWAFWPLVAPGQFAERLAQCEQAVRDVLIRKNSLSLADAVRVCKADESWVLAAFDNLKRGGEYITDQLPDVGLVISRASS